MLVENVYNQNVVKEYFSYLLDLDYNYSSVLLDANANMSVLCAIVSSFITWLKYCACPRLKLQFDIKTQVTLNMVTKP